MRTGQYDFDVSVLVVEVGHAAGLVRIDFRQNVGVVVVPQLVRVRADRRMVLILVESQRRLYRKSVYVSSGRGQRLEGTGFVVLQQIIASSRCGHLQRL